MTDLLRLRDKNTRDVAVDFLKRIKPSSLFVTGHSLGGTLAQPMFAYLNYMLYGGRPAYNMALWTFAGLTPGNTEFNDYFNTILSSSFKWRLHNSLDIAPLCWWSLENIKNIYKPYLDWGMLESTIIEDLFDQARGNGYAQPLGDKSLPGEFDPNFVDKHLWAAQAMHQHSTITYKSLVDKAYPFLRAVPSP